MKFSCSWLSDYVTLPADPNGRAQELASRLTAAALAVEHVERVGEDVVLDVDVTTNRVDAMNHLGLARDISAIFDQELRLPPCDFVESSRPASERVSIHLEDPRGIRYAARIVENVQVGPSPAWLRKRLEAIGQRSINNVVDVTNYVLWELGQPLHGFDLDTLRGGRISVRGARPGEQLVTLDGERRELDPEVLVIADAERAVGLAGVMGGLETEVTATTRNILLESAHFDPKAVRRGAKKLGLHTDACHRFERGADPEVCAWALERAVHLIQQVAGGEVARGVVDVRQGPLTLPSGRLELARLERFLGISVPAAQVERWLGRLGFSLVAEGEGSWRVTVPSWRYYDVRPLSPAGTVYEADLFEEVARLAGLDALPATLPPSVGAEPPPTPLQLLRRQVRGVLAASGFAEAITFAFQDGAEGARLGSLRPESAVLKLANPLSERYSAMRRSLLPGLVEAARFNQRRGAASVRLFEVARAFFPKEGASLPEEVEMVGLVAGGEVGSPWQGRQELDFYAVKGVLETLIGNLEGKLEARPGRRQGWVEGATAELWVDGKLAGHLGLLEEEEHFPLWLAELALEALPAPLGTRAIHPPSRFPAVAVDLTLTHSLAIEWLELAGVIRDQAPAHLSSFELKDRYHGAGVPAGAVNTTIAFLYHAEDRSLTQEEVNQGQSALASALQERFGLRAP